MYLASSLLTGLTPFGLERPDAIEEGPAYTLHCMHDAFPHFFRTGLGFGIKRMGGLILVNPTENLRVFRGLVGSLEDRYDGIITHMITGMEPRTAHRIDAACNKFIGVPDLQACCIVGDHAEVLPKAGCSRQLDNLDVMLSIITQVIGRVQQSASIDRAPNIIPMIMDRCVVVT